ncbi:hypothetical protein [Pseudodesulfovibrio piezophilus]|uniref:TnsE C-terminal domain-containing protein n=1 Tax=Pseudodesulfovibrio piezophilus (strain DSM 21447 / JCM 15486 / C1TLV30) TaxID=1322246 RepID=M1WWW0_PSEP2|nr:hypothetical protein [Pseudodesulfovibrio piezophilus]CCH49348.1 conserved protein of unknown function [Pseudodesulfovibrio piezophilus C1TLV30]
MPFDFNYEFDRIQSSVVLKKSLFGNDRDWIVWWYSGINKSSRAKSQPYVWVAFKEIVGNQVSEGVLYRRVLLTSLGSLRLGSVWRHGRCRKIARFEERTFEVNFTNNFWHTSFDMVDGLDYWYRPFDQGKYPLHFEGDKNINLQFKAITGELISIPSLEFFSRMYGASEEVKRVIATYGREECKRRFFRDLKQPTDENVWKIARRKKFRKSDNAFLAHLFYDQRTKSASKKIYSQIESGYDKDAKKPEPIFIEVDPWFVGKTKLILRGISCDNGNAFLGLQIMGYDLPLGKPIVSLLMNKYGELQQEPVDDDTGGKGRVKLEIMTPPDEAHITDDSEPNQGGSIAEIQNHEMKIGNPGRVIIEEVEEAKESDVQDWYDDITSTEFSTDEPQGTGGDIGFASIHNPTTMESKGKLRDVWDALLYLKECYPDKVSSVQWFTIEDGFSSDEDIALIAIKPFRDDDEVEAAVRSWVFLDAKKKTCPRGLLVVRIVVQNVPIYIVEIQRRHAVVMGNAGESTIEEESLTGLVFTLYDQNNLESWLRQLRDEIRYAKGVFKKVKDLCPGESDFFNHSKAKDQSTPEEASVRNALRKVGVTL